MDRIEQYRQLVKQVICDYAAQIPATEGLEKKIIFKEEIGYYALMQTGWLRKRRVYGNIIHCDIQNGKIWVQHDGTEDGIVEFFLKNGVPTEDIVIARHPPEFRHLTEFAVG
jgi:hypothetical protein